MVTVKTREVRLQNSKHNKFWRYFTLDNIHWVAHWGPVGKPGQYKVMLFSNVWSGDRYWEKKKEGYVDYTTEFSFEISQSQLDCFKQSLNLQLLGTYFLQHRGLLVPAPSGSQLPSPPSKRKLSSIEAQLERMLKQNGT